MKSRQRFTPDCDLLVSLPYPSGVLHKGHIIGSFLPADIFKRYGRMRRLSFKLLSGVDSHGTNIFLEALKKNQDPSELVVARKRKYLKILKSYAVSPDSFKGTHERSHHRFVRKFFKQNKDLFYRAEEEVLYCPKCQLCLTDRLAWDLVMRQSLEKVIEAGLEPSGKIVCTSCKTTPSSIKKTFLKMRLVSDKEVYVTKNFPAIERSKVSSKTITRYLPWGVKAEKEGEVYYVWVEALLTYKELSKSKKTCFFFGKDNLYYHTTILRNLVPKGPQCVKNLTFCREYLRESGQKISSSKGAKEGQGGPVGRLALVLSDPRNQDREYKPLFEQEARKILYNGIMNTIRRIKGLMRKGLKYVLTEDGLLRGDIEVSYREAMKRSQLRKALDSVIIYNNLIKGLIQDTVRRKAKTTSLPYHAERLRLLIKPLIGCDPLKLQPQMDSNQFLRRQRPAR